MNSSRQNYEQTVERDLPASQQIIVWGTYDIGKPRVRILLQGLEEIGIDVKKIHADVWSGIEDKSQLKGGLSKLKHALYWLSRYPRLLYRFKDAPKQSDVLVSYLGHFDVLILWPFAKLRGSRIIWDAFLSLYNTIVEDRQLISPWNPLAWLIYSTEWLATRAADLVVLDTQAHADYFADHYNLSQEKLISVFVGAEHEKFPVLPPLEKKPEQKPITVLFYGQFIPLHGIATIIEAARRMDDGRVKWVIIGKGQEEESIRAALQSLPVRHLTWIPWVPYEELVHKIAVSDVCLGIFSKSEKASRVIPNKVFQILSCGRPLITRDSPAIRELIDDNTTGVYLIEPEAPESLTAAIEQFRSERDRFVDMALYSDIRSKIEESGVGASFYERTILS